MGCSTLSSTGAGGATLPDRRLRHRQVPPTDRPGRGGRDAGFRVRYVLATKLVNELVEAAGEKQLSKTIARYGRVDLCALMNSATWSVTAGEPSCCFRF